MQITPLSTTASIAIAAFGSEKTSGPDTLTDLSELLFVAGPILIIAFNTWFLLWCHREISEQFRQIVLAETGMGFYSYKVGGRAVLPERYRESPVRMRPTVRVGLMLQGAGVLIVLVIVALRLAS